MRFDRSLPVLGALTLSLAFTLSACAPMASSPPVAQLKDGEMALPADYKGWPKFLSAVQLPDAKQVREIYMSTTVKAGTAANGRLSGTMFVMKNYAAANADGTLKQGADGNLLEGDLRRVFRMGKNEGWGQSAHDGLKNGYWICTAYPGSGKKAADPTVACRACHLPLVNKDVVHRYDEHFSQK